MDSRLLVLFFTSALLFVFFPLSRKRLPPGPLAIPILGSLIWLRRSLTSDIEQLLRDHHSKYGPIITHYIGSLPAIFISDRALARKALIEHGADFSDRPLTLPAIRFLDSNQHNITSASYGALWRLLRRNLTSQVLHPAKLRLFAGGREWAINLLLQDLRSKAQESSSGAVVVAMERFQYSMFCIFLFMCFGEKLGEEAVRDIEAAHTNLLLYNIKLNVFFFVPRIAKYIFCRRWKTVQELRQRQIDAFVPMIRARRAQMEVKQKAEESHVHSYVDSLLNIRLAEEDARGLTEDELVTLCSEFLTAGTDTTSTSLQWIMAELVMHQEVQHKLAEEIELAMAQNGRREVGEEDLQRMPYLKAVIMEGLRRHPPSHFVVPHSVSKDVDFEGYVIPKNALINFSVANIGLDGNVWEKPMEFVPERFMAGGDGEGVDITGSREIKMMPFGVGRRICPGVGLAMLHLQYFVANLVREFEWAAVDCDGVDFSEQLQFTVVMKNPLKARISQRRRRG